jgi:hypothetical protein
LKNLWTAVPLRDLTERPPFATGVGDGNSKELALNEFAISLRQNLPDFLSISRDEAGRAPVMSKSAISTFRSVRRRQDKGKQN